MIKNISFFLVNTILSYFFSNYAFSQNIREIEIINNNYFSDTNQVIEIKYTSKTRDKAKTQTRSYLLNFESLDKGSQNLFYLENNSKLYFKLDNKHYYFRHPDSLNYTLIKSESKIDLFKNKIPNNLSFVKDLPLSFNTYFLKNGFISVTNNDQLTLNDTLIIEQISKKTNVVRKIFLNKERHIFRTEYFNLDSNSLQEKWQYEYKIYKNTDLIKLADSLNFGPFNKSNFVLKNKNKIETEIFYDHKIRIPLTSNKILNIDTSKIKYYVVDLWYIGCKPCSILRPYLETFYSNLDTTKAYILGYNEFDVKEDINRYSEKKKLQIPEIDKSLFYIKLFQTNSRPTVLILDKKFKVIETYVGYSTLNILKIRTFLKAKKLFL